MPFKKTGKGRYRSKSGKTYSARQVRAYYATKGFKRPVRTAMTGGTKHVVASGGGSL